MQLTTKQLEILDQTHETPPRIRADDQDYVVLTLPDHQWIRGLLPDLPEAQIAVDPRTHQQYALVPVAIYERFKAFFEETPVTREEQRLYLQEFGKRIGWDDPALDVYDAEERSQ